MPDDCSHFDTVRAMDWCHTALPTVDGGRAMDGRHRRLPTVDGSGAQLTEATDQCPRLTVASRTMDTEIATQR